MPIMTWKRFNKGDHLQEHPARGNHTFQRAFPHKWGRQAIACVLCKKVFCDFIGVPTSNPHFAWKWEWSWNDKLPKESGPEGYDRLYMEHLKTKRHQKLTMLERLAGE